MVSDMDEKAQPSLLPPSFVAAKQIEARIAGAEPLSMTQEEVETMAKGGSGTGKIVERLAAQGSAADVHSEKASPVVVTADDLAKIEKSGEIPAKLRQRLEESARAPEESISRPVVTEKSAPTLSPIQQS
jgi:hypothetical protein